MQYLGFITIAAMTFGLLAGTKVAVAEDSTREAREIEEIIVNARKREEELQDVPLSVTAFDANTIELMYGDNLGEFSKYTPNLQLARQPYAGNALFGGMRGIVFGDLEKSFDPAVGVVIDGVALVNNTTALIDTFDLEGAEILRGPQGTLFGRNTIAGVVNVRRSRPTGEFGLKTQLRAASHDELDLKAVLNFALNENVAIKIAAFSDRGDGYQEKADFNLATGAIDGTGDQIDGEDTLNLSTSILWEPNDRFDALFTFDYSDDESVLSTPTNLTAPAVKGRWDQITGTMFAAIQAQDATAVATAIGATMGAGGNFCDLYGAVVAPLNGWVKEVGCNTYGSILGEETGYKYSITAQDFINEIETRAYTAELVYDFDNLTLSSITSYRKSEELLDEDNLGAPVEIFNPYRPQEFDQFSTELRLTSDLGRNLDYQIGLYYLESSYEITASIWALGALSGTRESGVPPSPDGDAGQDLNTYAVFGEVYYSFTDQATLTVGGRWTKEEKEFFIFQRKSGDSSGILPPTIWGCGNLSAEQRTQAQSTAAKWVASAPDDAAAAARTQALVCEDNDGNATWTEFTPRISLDYRFNDNIMGYASWSRGFRSGGWNGRATTPGSIGPYDPETVDSYEAGLRMSLLDNSMLVNLTVFRAEYEDKQENEIYAFGLATETVVNNAAEATIDGAEFEMRYILSDNIQLRMALGYVDGEYNEFLQPADPADRDGPKADYSGTFAFAFAPEYTASLGFDASYPLDGDLGTLAFTGNYSWTDETVGNFGLPDPQGLGRNEFPNRETVDVAVTWKNPIVDVSLFGKNITEDDNYLATSVDVGVFFFGSVSVGKIWGIEVTKEW